MQTALTEFRSSQVEDVPILMETEAPPRLTVLSFGAGQDSTMMLYEYWHNPEWRAKWAPEDFVVVCSDTGDEHPETYEHIERVKTWCAERGIEFHHLTKDQGYHTESWPDLITYYEQYEVVQVHGFTGACTQQLKVGPIYKWLDAWIGQKYGFESGNKNAIHEYGRRHGKIRVLLGMADKETTRVPFEKRKPEHQTEALTKGRAKKPKTAEELEAEANPNKWTYWLDQQYPLYMEGIDRAGAQARIRGLGYDVPPPSNCMRCHFMSPQELVYLDRFYPEKFVEWERLEHQKFLADLRGRVSPRRVITRIHAMTTRCAAPPRVSPFTVEAERLVRTMEITSELKVTGLRRIAWADRNGVYGKPLREKLEEAKKLYGHWTDEQLREYKMSHGHCVATRHGV